MNPYIKNYLGYEMSDDELQNVAYPTSEMITHVTARTFQVGCIGATLFGTLSALSKSNTRNLAGIVCNIILFNSTYALLL